MTIEALEAATKLGVHPTTVTKLCERGLILGEKRLNSKYRYAWFIDWDGLNKYLAERPFRRKPKCKPLSETDKAYMSGLFDGEGCFTSFITHTKSKGRSGKVYHSERTVYYIQILVVEEEPIRWLKEVTGLGYVFQRKRREQGWQDLWGWRAECGPACEVVEQIMPYLKIKHRHAEIFLELRDRVARMKNYRKGGTNDAPMPAEEWIERQKLIDEIHRLNKRTGKVIRKGYSVQAT